MNQHSVLRPNGHAAVPVMPAAPAEEFHLRLLGGFDPRVGEEIVTLPLNVRRLMALLAVRELPQTRASVADTLWMDVPQSRATANLRSTLWKFGPQRERLMHADAERLWLSSDVQVDLTRVVAQAKRLIGPEPELQSGDTDVDELANDLLPDWDEDWLRDEREQLRQLRVHALEALCTRLRTGGRGAEAVCAGQAAVAAEPLRESAQRLLITAHLAEGTISEADVAAHLGPLVVLFGEDCADQSATQPWSRLRARPSLATSSPRLLAERAPSWSFRSCQALTSEKPPTSRKAKGFVTTRAHNANSARQSARRGSAGWRPREPTRQTVLRGTCWCLGASLGPKGKQSVTGPPWGRC